MAKKICRTCLKHTISAFKTHETISSPDEFDTIKISDVLRFLVPELYLGVTINPEICSDCRAALKSAYIFRKQCLHTEHLIGTYLKNARCTARSVDLYDVLDFLGNQPKLKSVETKSSEEVVESNAQKIISDWEDDASEGSNLESLPFNENKEDNIFDKEGNTTTNNEEVPVFTENTHKEKIRVRTNLFHIDNVFTLYENDQNDDNFKIPDKEKDEEVLKKAKVAEVETPAKEKQLLTTSGKIISKEENKTLKKLLEQPKIFTPNNIEDLNTSSQNASAGFDPIDYKVSSNEPINKKNTSTINDTLIEIKSEPLDVDQNADVNILNNLQPDEDTLPAPESAPYNNIQGLINNLPETYNNQYVDVPDFVQINNFSLTDFDQLRQFQNLQKMNQQVNSFIPLQPGTFSLPGNTVFQANQNQVLQTVVSDSTVVSSGNNLVVSNSNTNNPTVFKSNLQPIYLTPIPASQVKTLVQPVRKRKRRLKLVPVGDIESEEKKEEKYQDFDRDVCVLFTNYTIDGVYVNDHDYLIAPYKRNKILLKENENWICLCHICGDKHPVDEHMDHMKVHESSCSLCKANLGTPYMLNMHMRSHEKPCKFCTQTVSLIDKEKHELKHLEEDREFETERQKRYHWSKRGRKKQDKDEKPVYFAIRLGSDSEKESPETPRLRNSLTVETTTEVKDEISSPKTNRSVLKIRPMRKKRVDTEELDKTTEIEETPTKGRVLRSNVKKSETDDKTGVIK